MALSCVYMYSFLCCNYVYSCAIISHMYITDLLFYGPGS